MNMKTETTGQKTTCHLFGRLDTLVSLELEPEVDKLTEAGNKLVFDFSEVDYISSTFLRICLKEVKALGQENFWIESPKSDIKKVFKIAGLEKLIRE